MTILFCSDSDDPAPWREALARALPDMPFRVWPDVGAANAVRYALAWRPHPGALAQLPNLRAVLVLGAGVDSVLSDPTLPPQVPVLRLVDAGLAEPMAIYALHAALFFHRRAGDYLRQQAQRIWKLQTQLPPTQWPVGVMGLGVIGAAVARRLVANGFPVVGWSRTQKALEGVEAFAGRQQFPAFLARSRVVINALPLTPETEGILDLAAFVSMPDESYLVNIGRGDHVVDADLIGALDSGHLAGAMLDVFREEPLPADHPFWRHPRIMVTPHAAAPTMVADAQAQIIENIRRLERSEPPTGLVDRARGY
jgi:glyoxylate/hydroxypyruvate reductase A